MRTLKEECLYLHDLDSLEQAREIIGQFIERLQPRLAPQAAWAQDPAQVRMELTRSAA